MTIDPIIEKEVRAFDAEFEKLFNAGEVDRLVDTCYAPDAVLMPAGAPAMQGPDAIKGFMREAKKMGFKTISLNLQDIEVGGDLVLARASYTLRIEPDGAPPFDDVGKSLLLYRRTPNGLRAVYDMFNSDNPPPAP